LGWNWQQQQQQQLLLLLQGPGACLPLPTAAHPASHARSLPPSLARLQRPAEAPQQKLQAGGGGVVQLYRYPGLTQSKAKTLLRKAQEKASSKIVGIDGELVSRHSAEACWH
jgi:hypothetical protein